MTFEMLHVKCDMQTETRKAPQSKKSYSDVKIYS